TQGMQVVASRSKIVVDEYGVRLAVRSKLVCNLLRMPHAVRHSQSVGRQVAEAAAIVTAAGCNQAGGRKEAVARNNGAPRRGVLAIVILVGRDIARLQPTRF